MDITLIYIIIGVMCIVIIALIAGIIIVNNKKEEVGKKFNDINNQVIADKLKIEEADKKFISGLKQIQSLPIADDSILINPYMVQKIKLMEQRFMQDIKQNKTKTEYTDLVKKIETDERLTKIMKETGYDINNNHRLAGKYFIDIPPLEESEAGEILLKACNKIPHCHGINLYNTNYENKNPPLAKMVFTDPANTNNLAYYVNNPESYSISKSSLTQKLLE